MWSLFWSHFDAAHMNAIYKKYENSGGLPVFHLSEERMKEYKSVILRTYFTATSMSHMVDMALSVLLTEMLEMLMQDAWSNRKEDSVGAGTVPNGQIPAEIKSYIEENYKEKLTLEVIAKRFYINKQYLARIFQKAYGISVGDHIANIRISVAKEMLRFTDMRIEEIGASVDIEDSNYFARVFKRLAVKYMNMPQRMNPVENETVRKSYTGFMDELTAALGYDKGAWREEVASIEAKVNVAVSEYERAAYIEGMKLGVRIVMELCGVIRR